MTTLAPQIRASLLQSKQIYCLVTDKNGTVVFANEKAADILQYTLPQLIQVKHFLENYSHTQNVIRLTHSVTDTKSIDVEWEVYPVSGGEKEEGFKWIASINEPTKTIIEDQNLFQNLPLACLIIDAFSFSILQVNKAALELYGYAEEEFKQLNFLDLSHLADKCFEINEGEWLANPITPIVVQHLLKNNSIAEMKLSAASVTFNQQAAVQVICQKVEKEITENVIQSQPTYNENFYKSLVEDSLDGILVVNEEGTINFCAPSIKDILGFEVEEVVNTHCFKFIHPADIETASHALSKELSKASDVQFISIRLLKKNGEWLWCMVRGHNLMDATSVKGIVIYYYNDIARRNANEALIDSEEKFRSLIKNLSLGVWVQDMTGKVITYNKAALDMLGVQEHEAEGNFIYNFITDAVKEDMSPLLPVENPVLLSIENKTTIKDFVIGIRKNSTHERVWIMMTVEPILTQDQQVQHSIVSMKDITARKKMEKKQVKRELHQQKLLTQAMIDGQEQERKEIGKELHDNIGQQLTTIKLFLDMAKSTADDETCEMVNLSLKGVSDVINEIRKMSRSLVPPSLGDLGLIDSIKDLLDLIRRTQTIKIVFNATGFNEAVIAENLQLMLFRIIQEQVNNILKHAQATAILIKLKMREEFIELSICDNGCGFNFTQVKKGVGLANIRNRAELFGGTMDLKSEPGEGCSLKVFIPVTIPIEVSS